MLVVSSLDLYPGSQEERLPGFSPQFPHLSSLCLINRYPSGAAPWHWHKSVELFYVRSGALTYYTPGRQQVFRAGMGGMVKQQRPPPHRTGPARTGDGAAAPSV